MAYEYIDGTGLWMNEAGDISLTDPQGNALPQQQGPGYKIVTPVNGQWMQSHPGLRGADLYAMFPDGRVERLYEANSGAHGAAPERILESELAKYQGQAYANSADPFSSSFVAPVSYTPATQRQSRNEGWEDTAPALWMGAFGGAAASAAMGGGAGAATGAGAEAAAGSAGLGATAGGAGGATLGGTTAVGSGLGGATTAGTVTAGLGAAGDMFGSGAAYDGGAAGLGGGTSMPAAIAESPATLSQWGLSETSPGVWEAVGNGTEALGTASTLSQFGDLASGLWDKFKGLVPSGMDGNKALAIAPILAAIAYAKGQGGFDTGRMESTYDAFDPNAMAFEYDQNTARGRDALSSSLTNRGVMGSSFGNMDMTNFGTSRDLGRRSLINQGFTGRMDAAKAILDAQFKERQLKNQLYGTSLLALGNVFGGGNK